MSLIQQIGSRHRHFIVYLFPPVLIIANYFSFRFFTSTIHFKEGYLVAMIVYWFLFCLVPVYVWIKRPNRKLLLKRKRLKGWQIILLIIPVFLAFAFGPFKYRIADATPLIIFLSLIYAIGNAFFEEFLWRGLYCEHYPKSFFYAVLAPGFWFGIWHYVPLSFQPSNIGNFYFILSAMGLGFCWAVVTYYTKSIFWSIISHILVDFSGLGILYYFT